MSENTRSPALVFTSVGTSTSDDLVVIVVASELPPGGTVCVWASGHSSNPATTIDKNGLTIVLDST